MNRRLFYADLLERTAWTAFEAGAAVWIARSGTFDALTLKAAGGAALIAGVKCLIGARIGNQGSASTLPEHLDPTT